MWYHFWLFYKISSTIWVSVPVYVCIWRAFGMQSSSTGRGPFSYIHMHGKCVLEKLLIKITKLITIYWHFNIPKNSGYYNDYIIWNTLLWIVHRPENTLNFHSENEILLLASFFAPLISFSSLRNGVKICAYRLLIKIYFPFRVRHLSCVIIYYAK